jgi:hypothetical protein
VKRIRRIVVLFIVFCVSCISVMPITPPPGGSLIPPGMQLSEEERKMFELVAQLSPEEQEQLLGEILEQVSQLPEEKQKEFWSEVESTQERIESQMKEYFDTLPEPTIPDETPTLPEPVQPIKKELPEEKKVDDKAKELELQQIAALIDNLLSKIESVLRKVSIIPGFETQVERWGMQGEVAHWPAQGKWNAIKLKIEELVQQLHRLTDRDAKTAQYKHLSSLHAQQSLYNNIAHVYRLLSQHEPDIETVALQALSMDSAGEQPEAAGVEAQRTMSKASKNALQKVLGGILEGIYVLGIPNELEKLMKEYEPRAQVLRQEEESFRAKALQEAQKTRVPTPVVHAGKAPAPVRPSDSKSYKFPSLPSYTPPSRAAGTAAEQKRLDEKEVGPKSKADASASPAQAPAGSKEDKDKKEKDGKKVKKDPLTVDYLSSITKNLETVLELVSTQAELQNMNRYMLERGAVNPRLANDTIPVLQGLVAKSTAKVRGLKTRISKRLDKDQKDKYTKEAKDLAAVYAGPLQKLSNQIQLVKAKERSIAPDKKYAYLGGRATPSAQVAAQVPTPASLYDLKDKVDELLSLLHF